MTISEAQTGFAKWLAIIDDGKEVDLLFGFFPSYNFSWLQREGYEC